MATDCQQFCNTCIIRAGRKGQGHLKKAKLTPITLPDEPMELVTIDILKLNVVFVVLSVLILGGW